jgi:hypothetical protein
MTYYYESWFDRHLGKIMIGFFGTAAILLAIGIYGANQIARKHYQQCLDDGKKEYECYAIVHNGGRR